MMQTTTPPDVPPRNLHDTVSKYLPDLIFGANDGIITTLAVVSGVVGASLSSTVILILGFANLLADGFSMGVSNVLSRRSDTGPERCQPCGTRRLMASRPSPVSLSPVSCRWFPTLCPGSSPSALRRRRCWPWRHCLRSAPAGRASPHAAGWFRGWKCYCSARSRPQWPSVGATVAFIIGNSAG